MRSNVIMLADFLNGSGKKKKLMNAGEIQDVLRQLLSKINARNKSLTILMENFSNNCLNIRTQHDSELKVLFQNGAGHLNQCTNIFELVESFIGAAIEVFSNNKKKLTDLGNDARNEISAGGRQIVPYNPHGISTQNQNRSLNRYDEDDDDYDPRESSRRTRALTYDNDNPRNTGNNRLALTHDRYEEDDDINRILKNTPKGKIQEVDDYEEDFAHKSASTHKNDSALSRSLPRAGSSNLESSQKRRNSN
jgi:hypothetical protein